MRAPLALVALIAVAACSSTNAHPAAAVPNAVPWLPLPRGNQMQMLPSPGPPVPIPAGTAACQASQLEGRYVGSFGAIAGLDTPIVIRNASTTQCYVNGTPELKIVDAAGAVLATVGQDQETGTQVDAYIADVDVLLTVATPPLSASTGIEAADDLPFGLAFMNIEWAGCAPRAAGALWVDLPGGAGRLTVDFPVAAPDPCTTQYAPLVRDPWKPTGIPWPPAPDYLRLHYAIDSPKSAHHGSTLVFYVTVLDLDSRDYDFTPCPDYAVALVPGGTVLYYQLNCAPAGALKTGDSVTFQMKFAIPDWTTPGPWTLLWGLLDGRTSPPSATTPITIT